MKETVLIIREFDNFSRILAENEFEVINLPLIQTLPVEDFHELDAKLIDLAGYNGIFLTSPRAAEVFLKRCAEQNFEFSGKVYVLGNRAKTLFANTNFEIIFRENTNTAEEFIKSFDEEEFAGQKFLFVRGDKSLRTVPELLKNTAKIDEIVVYRTLENKPDERSFNEITAKLHQKGLSWICFFSPSGVEYFIKLFDRNLLSAVKIAVIGTTTAKKVSDENLKADFIATTATAESFALELIEHFLRNG